MNTLKKLISLSLIILLSNSIFAEETLTPETILSRTKKIYAKCKSYKDNGYVKTVFLNKDGKKTFTTKKVFNTIFTRPDKFRFEYAEKKADELQGKYIVFQNGKILKTFWELTGEKIPESLSMALAGATGVSSGTAHTIPTLLISEISGRKITNIQKLSFLKERKDDNGKLCYLIKSKKKKKGESLIVWIQKETFLITKIETTTTFDTFDTKGVTIYHPEIDTKILETEFKLKK